MTDADWDETFARSLMLFLNGEAIPEPDSRGGRIVDDSLLVLVNGDASSVDFRLPNEEEFATGWSTVLDTSRDHTRRRTVDAGEVIPIEGRTVVVLLREPRDQDLPSPSAG